MAHGLNTQLAAESAIQLLAERAKALSGVIAEDAPGRIGRTRNTPRVAYICAMARGDAVVCVYG